MMGREAERFVAGLQDQGVGGDAEERDRFAGTLDGLADLFLGHGTALKRSGKKRDTAGTRTRTH